MNSLPMSNSHQTAAPWSWPLNPGEARTLAAEGQPRWLRVDDGCVWLTRRNASAQADDIWLAAGQSLALPAGSEWVIEAWPQARLSLLLQAPNAVSRAARRAWSLSSAWRPAWLASSLLHA